MKRPKPVLYNDLKETKLFGYWANSNTKLLILCTGEFDYVEMRNGEVFNKDKGGEITALDKEQKLMTVSGLFGDSLYSYDVIDKNRMSIRVGKRAGVVGGLIEVANLITFVPENERQYLTRKKIFDCDKSPKSLGELLSQVSDQVKKGNYKKEGNTLVVEDPNEIAIEDQLEE
jgi:hypothetical protein